VKTAILSSHDYEPYGSALPYRGFEASKTENKYQFGFNGMEKDNEVGEGDYDFDARMYNSRIGRFFTIDPLTMMFSSFSPYVFAANCPIKLVDWHGLGPGDLFNTIEMAVGDFGLNYNDNSIVNGVEYATTIYQVNQNGVIYYSYLQPNKGTKDHCNFLLDPTYKTVSIAHTHGQFLNYPRHGDDMFSPKDKETSDNLNLNNYVITPDGSVLLYIHDTKKNNLVYLIRSDMPSDPNEGKNRKNTISPFLGKKDEPIYTFSDMAKDWIFKPLAISSYIGNKDATIKLDFKVNFIIGFFSSGGSSSGGSYSPPTKLNPVIF